MTNLIATVDGQDLDLMMQFMRRVIEEGERDHIRVLKFAVDTDGVHVKVNGNWSRPYGLAPRVDSAPGE